MLHVIRKINGTAALCLVSELFYEEHLSQLVISKECRPLVRYRNYGDTLMDSQKEWTECEMPENGSMLIRPLSTVHDLVVQFRKDEKWVDAMGCEYDYTQVNLSGCASHDDDVIKLVNQDDIVVRAKWRNGHAYISPPNFHGFMFDLSGFHVVGHPEHSVVSWRHVPRVSDCLRLSNSGSPSNLVRFTNA